jgi:DNA primase
MATPDEIRAVLAATDIVSLIGEDIELRKAGAEVTACCPFHDEKTPSFTVSTAKQFYHCFGCGAHGDALSWLTEYRRLPFPQALAELAGRSGIVLGANTPGERHARRGRQATNDIEAALHSELLVLDIAIGERVAYRQIPPDVRAKHTHIQPPPDDPLEREYEAARRIAKGLFALYGVRA